MIIGGLFIYNGFKFIKESVYLFIPGVVFLIFGFGLIVGALIIGFIENKESKFNPQYQIDPKQDSYIILNGEVYDTVPHGKLEEYIINDNQ